MKKLFCDVCGEEIPHRKAVILETPVGNKLELVQKLHDLHMGITHDVCYGCIYNAIFQDRGGKG